MNIPGHLKYTRSHEWAHQAADHVIAVGITDHAQEVLGDIVFLDLPQVGREVAPGETCAVVESAKAASDICSPVGGEILAINEDAAKAPDSVNRNAYAAWLFKVRPDNPADFNNLLDATAYRLITLSGDH